MFWAPVAGSLALQMARPASGWLLVLQLTLVM